MTRTSVAATLAFAAMTSLAVPAQSAPLGVSNTAVEPSAAQQVHYRYYRHHRYDRRPSVYFYDGFRHHRYWRHHRHWY